MRIMYYYDCIEFSYISANYIVLFCIAELGILLYLWSVELYESRLLIFLFLKKKNISCSICSHANHSVNKFSAEYF